MEVFEWFVLPRAELNARAKSASGGVAIGIRKRNGLSRNCVRVSIHEGARDLIAVSVPANNIGSDKDVIFITAYIPPLTSTQVAVELGGVGL